jgi:hypothetical protein
MKMRQLSLLACFLMPVLSGAAASDAEPLVFRTRDAVFRIDRAGSLRSIARRRDGREYLAPGQPAPILQLRLAGKLHAPESGVWDARSRTLTLRYPAVKGGSMPATAVVRIIAKPRYLVLETVDVQPREGVELVLWGPYPTAIHETIGETVGVVRDRELAVGIQALNARTLGGYPTTEDDVEPSYSIFDQGSYSDIALDLKDDQLFRGDTARPAPFGSTLQAFCRNRDRARVIANWGHERFVAPAFSDGGVVGSKIALFAVPAARALETIGEVEVAEGLPHPLIDGVWGKRSPDATASYLIVGFGEATLDRALALTHRAGLRYLYHGGPFETWGHFRLHPKEFPENWESLRRCVEKARAQGVRLGVHTLSNFITPNDPYVTPVPDPRLARVGSTPLSAAIDAQQTEIPVDDPGWFRKQTTMNGVVVGEELIKYASVSTEAPWRLLGCERGAWGTRAAAHAKGELAGKLMDHDYRVFLTDAALTQEVARRIAELCNRTGVMQLSFDGLEGAWSTGMGQYGRTLFTMAWYDALSPEMQGHVINDASNPGHFNWHVYTRMNWGEPWYAGFRESQTQYRLKNQLYFSRNLMPRMLGWFSLGPATSVEDAEWLLARAAGFDAGFALVTDVDIEARNGRADALLNAVRQWETARMSGAFPEAVKTALQDVRQEFHLEAAGEDGKSWRLYPVHVARGKGGPPERPGELAFTSLPFENPYAAQPLGWVLHNTGKGDLTGLAVELNGQAVLAASVSLAPGMILRYEGGAEATLYDASWHKQRSFPVSAAAARVGTGAAAVRVGCRAAGDRSGATPGAGLAIELRTLGPATRLRARRKGAAGAR